MSDRDFRIRNVSDTARWVASFRAAEARRTDALFRDTYAERLAGERGFEIAKMLSQESEQESNRGWAWVSRTLQFDKFISVLLAGGTDLVLNLAAGLDARPYRMELPPTLQWIEVDLAEVIIYKEEILANEKPRCRLERIALDLSEVLDRQTLFHQINARADRIAVISEGSLVYFSPEEVAALAQDLNKETHFQSWIIDISSAIQLISMQQGPVGRHLSDAEIEFKFGPPEGAEFFKRYGWEPKEIKGLLEIAAENNRAPEQFLSLLPDPRPIPPNYPWTGVCLLQKVD
jgi:methyltransferase (TIGR00027 family)